MKNLINIIKDTNGVSAYKVIEQNVNSYELFFVHKELETVRKSVSTDTTVTIYVDHDGKRGNSTFMVYASNTDEQIANKVLDAIKKANMINDQPYDLPYGGVENVDISSNITESSVQALGAKIANTIFDANDVENCAINALEIFIVESKTRVVNSNGIDKTQTKYTVNIEAIPTCNGESESVELYEAYTLAEFDEKWISSEINARMQDVKARAIAQKPSQKLDCPVLLNAGELSTLFRELVSDTNYGAIYMHQNLKNVGDSIQSDVNGDALTITMRAEIKGSPRSAKFDGDGTTLKDSVVIKDGIIVGGYGSSRFAQYLDKEPTGALGCVDVECGSTTIADITKAPHLECVYLSGLQVDLFNDYIGGEIRLAYYYDGVNRIPVTGISMSGKLSEVLNNITLSSEDIVYGGYRGPKKALLNNMMIF